MDLHSFINHKAGIYLFLRAAHKLDHLRLLHPFLLALAEFRFLEGKFRSLVGRIAYAMAMGEQVRGWGALKKMAKIKEK